MEINVDVLPMVISWAIISLSIYTILYYKYIYSILDPLFTWVITTSFASILAAEVIPGLKDVLHFFGCQLALWMGFVLAYKRYNFTSDIKYNQSIQKDCKLYDEPFLRIITYVLFTTYIFSNIIIGYNKGFAIFSDFPTEAKITNFQNGFGLFRKINWSTGTFISTSFIFLCFLRRNTLDLISLIIVIFISCLEGSKSAFLQIAISAGLVLYHPLFSNKKTIIKKFERFIPLLIVATLGVFFIILMKENDGLELSAFAFIKRLLYSADSLIYYYQPVNIDYFKDYNFWDYILRITNPILGFFRLQSYNETPGNIMFDNLRGLDAPEIVTIGPNAPFYIEGKIYFNYWVAFPYCIFIGYIYATVRNYYFSLSGVSAFYFVFISSFMHFAGAIIIDTNLAVTQSFDLLFFVYLPYTILKLIIKRKLNFTLRKIVLL